MEHDEWDDIDIFNSDEIPKICEESPDEKHCWHQPVLSDYQLPPYEICCFCGIAGNPKKEYVWSSMEGHGQYYQVRILK